jgi:hypothetical protein
MVTGLSPATTQSRMARRFSFRVPSVRWQFSARPDRDAPDPLVVLQSRVRLTHDAVRIGAGIDDRHGMHALLTAVGDPDDRRLTYAR